MYVNCMCVCVCVCACVCVCVCVCPAASLPEPLCTNAQIFHTARRNESMHSVIFFLQSLLFLLSCLCLPDFNHTSCFIFALIGGCFAKCFYTLILPELMFLQNNNEDVCIYELMISCQGYLYFFKYIKISLHTVSAYCLLFNLPSQTWQKLSFQLLWQIIIKTEVSFYLGLCGCSRIDIKTKNRRKREK